MGFFGNVLPWQEVRKPTNPFMPVVVNPLGVNLKDQAAYRMADMFCRDISVTMDNAAKVAENCLDRLIFL